jgi:hypothetical protein
VWHLAEVRPLVSVEVTLGLNAKLPLQLNSFEAQDEQLLHHINFRSSSRSFLLTTPTQPFGLWSFHISPSALDEFLDAMVDDIVGIECSTDDPVRQLILETAVEYSQDTSRQDVRALTLISLRAVLIEIQASLFKRLLRMWVGHSTYFDRLWRIHGDGKLVGAVVHEALNAPDVPRMLYWQLDYNMENHLRNLEKTVLLDLETLILERKKSSWLSAFLCTFIYLAILERDSWNLHSWEVKSKRWAQNNQVCSNPVSYCADQARSRR